MTLWLLVALVTTVAVPVAATVELALVTRVHFKTDGESTMTTTLPEGALVGTIESLEQSSVSDSQPAMNNQDSFNTAVENALLMIRHDCSSNSSVSETPVRVAPLQFSSLDSTVLMQASTVFVRVAAPSDSPQSEVWMPTSLRRHQLGFDVADAAALAALEIVAPFDVSVTINSDINDGFGFGDSDCDFVMHVPAGDRYFSGTTVILHELMHGMGIYTLMPGSDEGGYDGSASVFDLAMRWTDGGGKVINSATIPSASSLAGELIQVGGSDLYNPVTYRSGSSLSHFDTQGVMGATIGHSSCRFQIANGELNALAAIGWNCTAQPGGHTWDDDPVLATSAAASSATGESSDVSAWLWPVIGSVLGVVAIAVLAMIFYSRRTNLYSTLETGGTWVTLSDMRQ